MEAEVLIKKIEQLPENLQMKAEGYIDALLEQSKVTAPIAQEPQVKYNRGYGSLKGFVTYMADDFDEPLDEFKDYM